MTYASGGPTDLGLAKVRIPPALGMSSSGLGTNVAKNRINSTSQIKNSYQLYPHTRK